MKKYKKILIAVVLILVVTGSYLAYDLYKIIAGKEPISGKQGGIPTVKNEKPLINEGIADWTNWRGKNFEGKSETQGINVNWIGGLQKLWHLDYLCQNPISASWSAPVIKGNRLLVPGRDEKNDLMFCINTENGKLIWFNQYEAISGISHGPGPRATPFIDNDRVYSFGRSGDLVCWKLFDGELLWRRNVKDNGGSEPTWGYSTSPIVVNDLIITQGGGSSTVLAYNKFNGDPVWSSMEGDAGYSALITIEIENELLLLVYHATGLSLLELENGNVLWTVPWATDHGVNATTPLISNNIVFHTSAYGMGCQAIKISKKGYSVLWKSNVIEAQHSDPILIDGYIYSYSGNSMRNTGQFKCVELVSGKEMWSTDKIGQGTTMYVDGYLICLDLKGNLYLINPNKYEFNLLGKIEKAIENVKNPAWTVPVSANGKLYLRYLQQLICYKLD